MVVVVVTTTTMMTRERVCAMCVRVCYVRACVRAFLQKFVSAVFLFFAL